MNEEEDEESFGDLEFEEESEEFTIEEAPEEEPEVTAEEEEAVLEEEEAPPPAPVEAEPEEEGLIAPSELPVTLKVELSRVRMNADKLFHLQPGNFLELKSTIEQGVDLVVNGERVGRGELLRVGDVLGVRVTELG